MIRVRGSRAWLAGGLAALAGVVVGLLVVALVSRPGPSSWFSGSSDSPSVGAGAPLDGSSPVVLDPAPVTAPSVLPSTPATTPPAPTTAGVAAALAPLLRAPVLGSRVGVAVIDPASGSTIYATGANRPQEPASTAKLVTAASVLHFVGPDATIATRTVAGATPGEVVLVGGGDPTITVGGGGAFPRAASLDLLARRTATALAADGTRSVRLRLDDTLFTGPRVGPGWLRADVANGLVARVSALTLDEDRVTHTSDARWPDPTGATGRAFAAALRRHGVRVSATVRGAAAPDAAPLAEVRSAPVSALVERMLLTSDNDLAEALAHLAGVAAGTGGSFAGGSAASGQALAWLGVPAVDTAALAVVDGSGISPENRLDAAVLGQVLGAAARGDRPELAAMSSGLPVAGVTGSLADRFDRPLTRSARGLVRAKTGTLTGVGSLAGTVRDREGRTMVFVVVADRASTDTLAVRAALDRVATALAACGCG